MTIYTEYCSPSIAATTAGTVDRLAVRFRCWIRIQRLKLKLRQERRQLLKLSETMLRDLGVTRAQVEDEAGRRDIPDSRLALELTSQG